MTEPAKPRPLRERKPLTAERLRELVDYDPDTGIMTARVARPPVMVGDRIGTPQKAKHGRLITRINYTIYYVHRLAWLYVTGSWPERLVDHISGDPLDNRWCNLREATYGENANNRVRMSSNTSGAKNVGWNKASRRWRVIVKKDGHDHFFGSFKDKAEAIRVSHNAMRELQGKFARLG